MSIFINGNTTDIGSDIPTIYTSTVYNSGKTSSITFDVEEEPKAFVVLHDAPSGNSSAVLYTSDVMSAIYDGTNKQLVYTYQGGFGQLTIKSMTSFTHTYNSSTKKITISSSYYFQNHSYKLFYIC